MTKLTDKQRREIVGYLESGQDIPDDYKHVLFPSERWEYELVYAGKEREEDIIANTWGVPLQPVKTFNLPKKAPRPEWTNRLIFGDNLQVMKRLLDDPDIKGKVKLVYIDPPFATKQEFRGSQDQKAYQDKIAGAAFLEFLRKRFIMIRELLSNDGSLFLHVDQRKVHYLKVALDEVFGEQAFSNEIIWRSTNTHNTKTAIGQIHQVILYYRNGKNALFNPLRRPHFKEHIEKNYRHRNDKGRCSHCDITGPGVRTGDSGKPWRGYDPTSSGRHWQPPSALYDQLAEDISTLSMLERLDYFDRSGLIYLPENGGQPRGRLSLDPDGGNLIQDIWAYQPYTAGIYLKSKEGIDEDVQWLQNPEGGIQYPTQKPEGVLSRIVRISTSPGDIVLDAFVGSGTTLAVAEKLGRRWIGVDCGKLAIYTMQKRLMNLREQIGQKGRTLKAKPFTLYNAGLYDFKRMSELPWDDYRLFALQLFQVRDKKHTLAGIELDGFKNNGDVLVFNFKEDGDIVADEEYVAELHRHIGRRARDEFYIIAPASRVTFLEDYIDHGHTRYYILRIPYSIIDELHDRPFEDIRQPVDETEVNNTVDAVGFDFIIPPTVKACYTIQKPKGAIFATATITIQKFTSEAMTKKPRKFENRETLSMVMVDYDYKGNGEGIFDLDAVFYRDSIEKDGWNVRLDASQFGERIMIIYMNIFGNEMREVKTSADFGIEGSRVRENLATRNPREATTHKKTPPKSSIKKKRPKSKRKTGKKTVQGGK